MSCVYRGNIIETELSKNSNGGTEQMRNRLIKNIDESVLYDFAIHLSRPQKIYSDVSNILWLHDLPGDPANEFLKSHINSFDSFVFVSHWQMSGYLRAFDLPIEKCHVIQNAIESKNIKYEKPDDVTNFIYHTTPHRGLDIAYWVFYQLSKIVKKKIHFDVFSSFGLYGWPERDKQYENIINQLKEDDNVTYHGAQSNDVVLRHLEKSHVFLYPSTWPETSCISMIEAIDRGVLPVYHDYAALKETASENGISYVSNDKIDNAKKCLQKTLEAIENYDKYIMTTADVNKIERFTEKWLNLLTNLKKKRNQK
jgi:UDP-glucose:(glucosyl)LPS alpha-1,2-glucosyltransferase